MRTGTTSLLTFSIVFAACRDGSDFMAGDGGPGTPVGISSGSGGGSGGTITGGSSGGSSGGDTAAGSGSGSGAISGGSSGGSSSSSSSGAIGSGSSGGNSGSVSGGGPDAAVEGAVGAPDPYSGPFKVLVLSKTLGFHHDSIPAGQQMLRDLGKCIDAASCALTKDVPIPGAKADSSFTVDVAGAPANCPPATPSNYAAYGSMGCDGSTSDLSQFTTANLKNYQMLFFVSPTGNVFSAGGTNGKVGMAAIQAFIEGGGAYGGVHAASDFENTQGFPWYYNALMGAFFTLHNNDGTPGSVIIAPMYATHPVMRGLPSPLSTQDEWYFMNRQISAQPGFQILATLSGVPPVQGESASDIRPIVWVKQFPVATDPTLEGRAFYTCRGHNIVRFGEPDFRQLVHQGILWATHRLN
jgi:type 1 glutamine amidotransferase